MGEDRVGVLDTSCDQQGRASSGAGMRAGVSLRRAGVQAHSALHRLHSEEGAAGARNLSAAHRRMNGVPAAG